VDKKYLASIRDLIKVGDLTALQREFEKHPALARTDYCGDSWLIEAGYYGQPEVAKFLIALGCDVNQRSAGPFGSTALGQAVGKGHIEVARLLLQNGADPNSGILVVEAIVSDIPNTLEMVKLLDEYGADLNYSYIHQYSKEPTNALSMAIDYDKKDVVKYLRSRGCKMPTLPAPTKSETPANEVIAYFEKHFGAVKKQSLIEIVPTEPPIAIHVVPPTKKRDHLTLFTTGMSEQAMTVPKGNEEYRFAELFIQLPGDWPLSKQKLADPSFGWPIHWLRSMAKYPHQHDKWLGGPVSIVANGKPPKRLAPGVPFTCMLLFAEKDFERQDGTTIQLYRLMPLFTEERDLEKREGSAALMRAFDENEVPFVVDLKRTNVAKT
jgi:hypothetical protein